MSDTAHEYKLPSTLTSRVDLARLVREVELLDGDLESQKIRGTAPEAYVLPGLSRGLDDFLALNDVDLRNDKARVILREQLTELKDTAPIIHFTFATDADPESLQQLVAWVRETLHPQALVSVGLQPALVGGVYVRTPNHVHDFSIRALLSDKRDVLIRDLQELAK